MAEKIITDTAELKLVIKAAIVELNEETATEKQKAAKIDNLYTINEVRKRFGKAHSTVKKLISKGLIKTTKDGLISEAAIQDYLQNN